MVLAASLAAAPHPAAAQGSPPAPAARTAAFTVLIDAAHGGSETGTLLRPGLMEKDLVLSLSIRLRSALTARGMRVVTTRESDSAATGEARAFAANHAHAAACLLLHATANGSGVHLYTSSLAQQRPPAGLPLWSSAGAPYITGGLKLASAIAGAVEAAGLPYTLGGVRMDTLDAMQCPAVAVEVAPLHPVRDGAGSSAALGDPAYQARIVDALAAALLEWRAAYTAQAAGR